MNALRSTGCELPASFFKCTFLIWVISGFENTLKTKDRTLKRGKTISTIIIFIKRYQNIQIPLSFLNIKSTTLAILFLKIFRQRAKYNVHSVRQIWEDEDNQIQQIQNITILKQKMHQYRLGSKKGDGTFSQVFKATSIETGQTVAIKCMKKQYDSIQKVKKLTEIQALKILSPHEHIIKLIEVLYDEASCKLALVFQLMEQNLYQCLINNRNLNHMKIKFYMYGLLKGLAFVHKKGIFHRDIKPENVLISGNQIKLADFGSCKGVYSKHPYTQYISTRWYRAPQCLMTDGYYNHKMDIWGYGCVLFEMISRYPLFNGKNQLDQIHKINKILGTPSDQLIEKFKINASHMKPQEWKFQKHKGISFARLLPHCSKQLIDLLNRLIAYDPSARIEAQQALLHPYFQDLNETAKIQRFGSTMLSLNTSKQLKQHDIQDQRRTKIEQNNSKIELAHTIHNRQSRKKQREHAESLPPIHHIKLEPKPNPFNQTATSKFKKTNWQMFSKKKY